MLSTTNTVSSPFAMLLDPERVVRAMQHSERLNHLQRRIYRPLDKPLIPKGRLIDTDDYDRMVDAAADEVEEVTLD